MASISKDETEVRWKLSYANLESEVTQSHIHFSAPGMSGPVVVFLCSNLGNGPTGTQMCPGAPATISGTFTAAQMFSVVRLDRGSRRGIFEELIAALRAGATYANVHSTIRPAGEVRW